MADPKVVKEEWKIFLTAVSAECLITVILSIHPHFASGVRYIH